MMLFPPIIITSRLLPGLQIDNAEISITYAERLGCEGRIRYRWYIDFNNLGRSQEFTSDDLQSGCQGGSLQEGLTSLLAFLGSAAASHHYQDEDKDLFPIPVVKWTHQHQIEIDTIRLELEDTPNLIIE